MFTTDGGGVGKRDLFDFVRGTDVGTRWADLSGFSHTAFFGVYSERCEKNLPQQKKALHE